MPSSKSEQGYNCHIETALAAEDRGRILKVVLIVIPKQTVHQLYQGSENCHKQQEKWMQSHMINEIR
jgi:hypothetical protein